MTTPGSHSEVAVCLACAHVLYQRSRAPEDEPVKRSRTCPPGMSRFSSSAVPSAAIFPSLSTAVWSASSSASSRCCV
jgi:hypothetical protein